MNKQTKDNEQDALSIKTLTEALGWFTYLTTIHQDHLAKKMIFSEIQKNLADCLDKLRREQARNYGENS